MDSVFSLSYPEYAVAKELQSIFKQKDGYSIQIPLSRQQKGYDLVLYNAHTGKSLTIQIKSSRAYQPAMRKKERSSKRIFDNYLWFRCFDYNEEAADYYIFFGLYPSASVVNKQLRRNRKLNRWWKHIYVAFSNDETKKFLNQIKTKAGRAEKFFDFGFDYADPEDIFVTRGLLQQTSYKHHFLHNQVSKIKKMLK